MVRHARKLKNGAWQDSKTGQFVTEQEARRINSYASRQIVIKRLAERQGVTQREIKDKIKGISTDAILGRFIGRDLNGRARYLRNSPAELRRKARRALRRGDEARARQLRKLANERAKFARRFPDGPPPQDDTP